MFTSSTLQMDPKKPVRRVGAKPPPDRAQKAIGCLSLKNPFRSLVAFRRISGFQLILVQPFTFNIALSCRKHCIAFVEWKPFDYFILLTIMVSVIIIVVVVMALAQIPISTFSRIWVFVCQYGIMFVIIVIAIIIIIIYRKVKVSTLKHV